MKRYLIPLSFLVFSLLATASPVNGLLSILSNTQAPSADVLKLAKIAYECAVASGLPRAKNLTIIDYSLPSSQKRLWVMDMQNNRILFNSLVAHGVASGDNKATYFSNVQDSHASSLGLYLTGRSYVGHYGYSLRLKGLDAGFNDKAESRDVVVHGASYVSSSYARAGAVGRTWGCPAVPEKLAKPIINTIKGNNLVFAYYPDSHWLSVSKYLHCPASFKT